LQTVLINEPASGVKGGLRIIFNVLVFHLSNTYRMLTPLAVGAGTPGEGRRECLHVGFSPASMPRKPPPGVPAAKSRLAETTLDCSKILKTA
jgi:hypothetical protein